MAGHEHMEREEGREGRRKGKGIRQSSKRESKRTGEQEGQAAPFIVSGHLGRAYLAIAR